MEALDRLAADLRERLAASRVTIRVGPERNLPILAEALAPGVASMRAESAIDQNAAETVRWVAAQRRTLVVDDARTGKPATPRAMIEEFGLRAFMIAPLFSSRRLEGTVSVHVNGDVRDWSAEEVAELEAARDEVSRAMSGKH